MKLISIQSKEVLDKVMSDGVCYPDITKADKYLVCSQPYNDYIRKFNDEIIKSSKSESKSNVETVVWGFSHIQGEELSLENPNALKRAMEMIGITDKRISDNDKVIMELEVPDDKVLKTNFYTYTDAIFTCREENGLYYNKEKLFEVNDDLDTQGIFLSIRKEYLIRYSNIFIDSSYNELRNELIRINSIAKSLYSCDGITIDHRIELFKTYNWKIGSIRYMISIGSLSDNILKHKLIDSTNRLYTSSFKTAIGIIDNMIRSIDESDDEEFKKVTCNIINVK